MHIRKKTAITTLVIASILASAAYAAGTPDTAEKDPVRLSGKTAAFVNTQGTKTGTATLVRIPGERGMLVRVTLGGLKEGWHGMHLHRNADCTDHADGFRNAGGHINPDGRPHGILVPGGGSAADIPNIYAGPDGHADVEFLSLAEAPGTHAVHPAYSGNGFSIIVHAGPDDYRTQPAGNAGPRIACAAFTDGLPPAGKGTVTKTEG